MAKDNPGYLLKFSGRHTIDAFASSLYYNIEDREKLTLADLREELTKALSLLDGLIENLGADKQLSDFEYEVIGGVTKQVKRDETR